MARLGRVQGFDPRLGTHVPQELAIMAFGIEAHALLAAGDRQQFAVERRVPVPVQAGFGKGRVEGGAMAVAFGIGQRAVHIKNQGFQHEAQHSRQLPISDSHAFLWR